MLATRAAQRPQTDLTAEGRQAQAKQSLDALKILQDGLYEGPALPPDSAARIAANTRQPIERVQAMLDNNWVPPEALLR